MSPEPSIPSFEDYAQRRETAVTFENQILYRMCAEFPGHSDRYVTAGKIVAIGRIYAASPTRGAGEPLKPGSSLVDFIACELSCSDLDAKLNEIPFEARFSPDVQEQVLRAHWELLGLIARATSAWSASAQDPQWRPDNHASFASKYLHFHRPNAFPIMDSIVRSGLGCVGLNRVPSVYERFCSKLLIALGTSTAPWTPRSVDTELLVRGRQHGGRRISGCASCGHPLRLS